MVMCIECCFCLPAAAVKAEMWQNPLNVSFQWLGLCNTNTLSHPKNDVNQQNKAQEVILISGLSVCYSGQNIIKHEKKLWHQTNIIKVCFSHYIVTSTNNY